MVQGKGDLLIRKGIFKSQVGKITGIAFLVYLAVSFEDSWIFETDLFNWIFFKQDCPPEKPSFGPIASLQELPPTHRVSEPLECFQLYQQTDIIPNPIEEFNETLIQDFGIKFSIGSEICNELVDKKKYCNGQLVSNTNYGLLARLFTENGYRDTEPVIIRIDAVPEELISPKTFVACSVTALILCSLIIILCCAWCSKKDKKPEKEKEAAEADENLLSFTSYCVIDKNPLPRKSYSDS